MHGVNLTRCLEVDAVDETPADLSRGRVQRSEEDRDRGTLDLLQRGNRVAVVDLHLQVVSLWGLLGHLYRRYQCQPERRANWPGDERKLDVPSACRGGS